MLVANQVMFVLGTGQYTGSAVGRAEHLATAVF